MSFMTLLLLQGTLAATAGVSSASAGTGVPAGASGDPLAIATAVAAADAPPPGYPPPASSPPPSPPPPPPYGPPPPVYVQPVYGPPPLYPGVRVYPPPGPVARATPAPAPVPPIRSLPYTHDGFYLRLGVGAGFTSATHHDAAGNNISILAGDADISAAAGWAVARNVVVFGAFFVNGIDAPEVKINGATMNTAGVSGAFGGFGAGTGFFLEPVNIYISASAALMSFRLADPNNQTIYGTDWSLGFQAMVGKEWWVNPEWGAGVALDLKTAYLDAEGSDSLPWSLASAGLVLSLTCN